ncbi:MAG: ABC transporter permease [Pseudomonadota bacterium]|nr:ABC transporter permease [Pseudomonadota bacterium]
MSGAAAASRWRDIRRSALRSPTFLCGAAIVLFWVVCALFGPWLTPYDPLADDVINSLTPPSPEHWFGSDQLGRDVFSRVIAGARDILTVAPLATLLGTVAGTALGLASGYYGGVFDAIVGRIVDAFLALPLIVVSLLALVALGSSNATVIFVIGLSFTPIIARTVRAAVLGERELDYVVASHLRLESDAYVMFVEILPNVIAPVLVEATVRLGYAIFAVATLSFLGFGIQPPSPDWGLSIASNYSLVANYCWTVLFDALAIASLVIGVNLLADGVENAVRD